tara:strand:+ start:463 stop:582 length:120 start_codon:yes stop_codon:yes gene_type:complete
LDHLENYDEKEEKYPIIMMSCKTGENKMEFLDKISEMTS